MFSDPPRCRFCGGNLPTNREQQRRAFNEYMKNSTDPYWAKTHAAAKFKKSWRRWELRRAEKAGPGHVEALKREWAAQDADEKRWAEENRRLADEEKKHWKTPRDQRPKPDNSQPPEPERHVGRPVAYDGFERFEDDDPFAGPGSSYGGIDLDWDV
jgi:hypothetical protein